MLLLPLLHHRNCATSSSATCCDACISLTCTLPKHGASWKRKMDLPGFAGTRPCGRKPRITRNSISSWKVIGRNFLQHFTTLIEKWQHLFLFFDCSLVCESPVSLLRCLCCLNSLVQTPGGHVGCSTLRQSNCFACQLSEPTLMMKMIPTWCLMSQL